MLIPCAICKGHQQVKSMNPKDIEKVMFRVTRLGKIDSDGEIEILKDDASIDICSGCVEKMKSGTYEFRDDGTMLQRV